MREKRNYCNITTQLLFLQTCSNNGTDSDIIRATEPQQIGIFNF